MSINLIIRKTVVGYNPVTDFTPIAYITISPNLIAVNPKFPARTVTELVAIAKAQPGAIDIGSTQGSVRT